MSNFPPFQLFFSLPTMVYQQYIDFQFPDFEIINYFFLDFDSFLFRWVEQYLKFRCFFHWWYLFLLKPQHFQLLGRSYKNLNKDLKFIFFTSSISKNSPEFLEFRDFWGALFTFFSFSFKTKTWAADRILDFRPRINFSGDKSGKSCSFSLLTFELP